MTFIVLSNGDELDIRYPRPEQFTALDIAWSLSQTNRFAGRTIRPYSVAEHSLLVCDILEKDLGVNIFGQFAGLMHDAHEAFAGDMYSPGKKEIGPAWAEWEDRWERRVHRHFAITIASLQFRQHIHQADLIALATERRDLMKANPTPWPALVGITPTRVDLNTADRRAATWEVWRDRWLDRHYTLDRARNARAFPVKQP